MRLGRNLLLSTKAILRHRVRTALALSGTAVGVGAVLVMTAVGEGAEEQVVSEIEALGRNLLVVSAGDAERVPWRQRTTPKVTTLTLGDAEAILDGASEVERVAPAQDRTLRAKFGQISTMTTVRGTTPDYEEVRNFRTTAGRYFTDAENHASARVAVLGSRVKEVLFPDEDPIGKALRVGRVTFTVIGVLESIYVQVRDGDRLDQAEDQVAAVLRTRHRSAELDREDDFAIQNQRVILAARLETGASFRKMILGLGAVALLVGGVGILSIMLLSVRERRTEVGLRVAVGARKKDILIQFLVESLLLGMAGGMGGVILGLSVAWGVGAWTEWQTDVNGTALMAGLTSALLVGVLFGVFPAQRAAALDPIDALQSE
jgi:putative ABC transport system permease protein